MEHNLFTFVNINFEKKDQWKIFWGGLHLPQMKKGSPKDHDDSEECQLKMLFICMDDTCDLQSNAF